MSADDRERRTARLTAAAAARTTDATARARRAITRLRNTGQPVTFVDVARDAGVSTSFLYQHSQLGVSVRIVSPGTNEPPCTPRYAGEAAMRGVIRSRGC